MSSIVTKLNKRLASIHEESTISASWKDPHSPSYDRQYAEDALFHTIGPLMDKPRWANTWSSPSPPVPEFSPGGPAPRWTEEEVVMAMAGNPELLFKGRDNPRSPQYGNKGGAPLFRLAKRTAKIYNRDDKSFIEDLYSNGFIALAKIMQPGMDEGRSPFVSYAIRTIQSAMEHGVGSDTATDLAAGEKGNFFITPTGDFRKRLPNKKKPGDFKSPEEYQSYEAEYENLKKTWKQIEAVGVQGVLGMNDPKKIRKAASIIKGKYQQEKSADRHINNPYGVFSQPFYQTTMAYADAIESGNEEAITQARAEILRLRDDIEKAQVQIGGASTGLGQAIDTPYRATKSNIAKLQKSDPSFKPISVASMHAPAGGGDDDTGSMAANIPEKGDNKSGIEPEAVNYILEVALKHDLGKILSSSAKYSAMADELGAKGGKIGGPLSANEFRYVIRSLGSIAQNYPGKGKPRSSLNVPRDGRNWWSPGEDPEIEPLPVASESNEPVRGGLWRSIWSRTGYEAMGPTAIAIEMTKEVEEFNHYGIPTAREVQVKKTGSEAVSKVSVATAFKAAQIKLRIVADIYSDMIGVNESVLRSTMIAEDLKIMDKIDRSIIAETARSMINIISQSIAEDSPPGWKGTVKAMKKHKEIDNPYALAWSMKKKGNKSHYKDDDSGEKKETYKESMKPVDALIFNE